VEGIDKPHRKIWEEYYHLFLERLACNTGGTAGGATGAEPFLATGAKG
jgi:hypothetical protein